MEGKGNFTTDHPDQADKKERGRRGKEDIAADERRFTQMGKEGNDGRGEELTTDHTDGKGE